MKNSAFSCFGKVVHVQSAKFSERPLLSIGKAAKRPQNFFIFVKKRASEGNHLAAVGRRLLPRSKAKNQRG